MQLRNSSRVEGKSSAVASLGQVQALSMTVSKVLTHRWEGAAVPLSDLQRADVQRCDVGDAAEARL